MIDNDYANDKKVIEAFQTMWHRYPEPAMLINRGKRVIAQNWACRHANRKVGSYCHEIGGCKDLGNSCLLNHCLETGQAVHTKVNTGKKQWSIHWVPIEGYPDYCVHFFAASLEDNEL